MAVTNHWAPFNFEQHGHLKLLPGNCVASLASQNLLPVGVREIASVGADCPVVFVKNKETGQFQLVAMSGLLPGQNLMIDERDWLGVSKPSIVFGRPFGLFPAGENGKFVLCVDESSDKISAHQGVPLFTSTGEYSDQVKARVAALEKTVDDSLINQRYADLLLGHKLLKPQSIDIERAGAEPISLDGVYLIDDAKLRSLDGEVFLLLRQSGFLTAIYAQMLSMQQLPRLIKALGGDNK